MRLRLVAEYCPVRDVTIYWVETKSRFFWWMIHSSLTSDETKARARWTRIKKHGAKPARRIIDSASPSQEQK